MAQDADTVLAELSSARTPWLALSLSGPASPERLASAGGEVTVIDIADPQAVPVTVNPLEPGPGYPVQAHADRVAGLFEAAFGLADPVAGALRAGLRRAYAGCGWDMLTGAAHPGAVASPAVPSFRQLRLAVLAAAGELGYSTGMRAAVHGFLEARLDALWAGPAGRFLEGGHPVDVARLLRGNVLVRNSGVADDEATTFLAGVLMLRLAEQLAHAAGMRRAPGRHASSEAGRRDREGPRLVVVIASPGGLPGPGGSAFPGRLGVSPRTAVWFSRLLRDVRDGGADIIAARLAGGDRSGPAPAPGAACGTASTTGVSPSGGPPAVSALLAGRRSAACGERCRRRPCSGYEMHAARLLADDRGQAWLRLWVQTLVLAFLTGRPLPRVPVPLRSGWRVLSPGRRDCLLATVVDAAVTARAAALRPCYDPRCLTSVVAAVAGRMLDAGDGVPFRAGHVWVIPQLRWLHEMERVNPLAQDSIRVDDIAPPLDFALAGLPDWPGIRVGDRLGGLRRHRLAMATEGNREAASRALLGDDGRAGLDADLAIAGTGLSPPLRLRYAARMMGAAGYEPQPGWLEVVLSWPHRIIRPASTPSGP